MWYNSNMSKLEDVVSLCKRRGFVFPGSEVYGGFAGTWDFGPLGVSLKKIILIMLTIFIECAKINV